MVHQVSRHHYDKQARTVKAAEEGASWHNA
jgi:hypothetical protein